MSSSIVPGIFEQNFSEVKSKLALIQKVAPLVQIDIADNVLVNGKTFLEIERLNKLEIETSIELHLMVTNPKDFAQIKINKLSNIYAQIEAGEQEIDSFIDFAQGNGYKIGLSLNPETPLSIVDSYVNKIQLIQFMTVTPGGQGRPLKEGVLKKIKEFKKTHPQIPIQVDGGLNKDTISKLVLAGVDSAEAGSAVFAQTDPIAAYLELEKLWKQEIWNLTKTQKNI